MDEIHRRINEEFIIEFVSAKTDTLIWEGVLNSKIKEVRKPEEKEQYYKDIVYKILSIYPPK